jgi:16S rRNA (guanine(1405)-N(7))-methyltransferase
LAAVADGTGPPPEAAVRQLVAALRKTRKYRTICDATLSRVGAWALARSKGPREASLAARRKLHQIYGAFWSQGSLARVRELLGKLPRDPPADGLAAVCRSVLALHSSTRERLPYLETCYAELIPPEPHVVLDLACGLNPFALPWMGLGKKTVYIPLDIDLELARLVNRFLEVLGRSQTAGCHDLLAESIAVEADVVLLLKTLPTLERQRAGTARELLGSYPGATLIVSFAARSLGGRDRGMTDNYDEWFSGIAPQRATEKFVYPGEVFYRLGPE